MSNDMVRVVEVEGWHVAVEGVGDPTEGRILDIEVGDKLGYSRGGKRFRQFIAALIKQGILQGVYVRTVTVQTSMPNGGIRTQTVREHWLTKEQILVAAAKSTTPVAQQILDQMVKVFVLVQERGGVAALTTTGITPAILKIQAETALLAQMNPLIDKAFAQLEDLEAKGAMDFLTASAHRTQLLKLYGGIDLTKAPMVVYEKAAQSNVDPGALAGFPVTSAKLTGPGNLPVTSIAIKARVNRGKNLYAYELGDLYGVTGIIIGQLARGAGIYEKITPLENEYGISYGHEHGVEGNTRDNWLYSPKSADILRELATNYLAALPKKPKKDSTKRFAVQIGKEWKDKQPLEQPTVEAAPN